MVTKVWEGPDIFSIQVDLPQNPLRDLNVYVICTPEQDLLIDTGFNRYECCSALWSGVRELGLDLRKTSVFLTHLHSDHTGLAGDFAERGCPICMGRIDYEYLSGMMAGKNLSEIEGLFRREGFPEEVLSRQGRENQGRRYGVKQMFPAQLVEDGATLWLGDLAVQCIHTPGHTPGHMALYLPQQQLLFSGDHILFDITPNISVWSGVADPLEDYLASLEKIRALPIQAAFPAHRHRGSDVYRRIDELQAHHKERLEEIGRAVEEHPGSTAYQIAGMISWSARGLGWEQFPPHQKWFAMGETLAHLCYLERKQRLVRSDGGDVFRYHIRRQRP